MRLRINRLAGMFLFAIISFAHAYGKEQCPIESPMDRAVKLANSPANDGRIAGGLPAAITDHPWQVALVVASSTNNKIAQFCGGAILNTKWVVTAAHCVGKYPDHNKVAILSGTNSLQSDGRRSAVEKIIVHPSFRKTEASDCYEFDIALIKVNTTSKPMAGEPIQIDAVPVESRLKEELTITGWGNTENVVVRTIFLQKGVVPIVDRTKCNAPLSLNGKVRNTMFCAGYPDGKTSICSGDSGGPATVDDQGTKKLRGLASWTMGCGVPGMYGVYTDIGSFSEWLRSEGIGPLK